MRSPPSAAAAAVVVLVVVMGLERERERERGWMLKIYCVCSHIDSFASAILATPPMHPRRCGRFKDDLTLCVRYQ